MNDVMQAVGVFFGYAVLAVFAQNAVFTRGLGVSRLVQLVGDERTSSGWFALLLCVTQVLVAPLAFYAGGFIAAQSNPAQLRPLVYLACVAVVSLFEFIVLWAARGKRHGGQLLRILPLAAVNSGVLGTVLVERTQSFTLEQSMGFGLGSGLGYLLAVMLVTEADRRLRSEAETARPLYRFLEDLEGEDKYALIRESIKPAFGNFIVAPKEVDSVIDDISRVIANGINIALHKGIGLSDVDRYR